jgi:membrane protease YdiL (CAAX protease family)
MGIYFEALILYFILFLSGSAGSIISSQDAAGFSSLAVLSRVFFYNIPSIALIWYLILKVKPLRDWAIVPGKNDIISFFITLPCLILTGFAIAFISSYLGGTPDQTASISPSTGVEWAILSFSCLTVAYLEEMFFRFYILARRSELKLEAVPAMTISVIMFAVCHIYEGPWGFLNAAISGVILGFVFLRYRALHGIAFAHGAYNISVYIVDAILKS